ncbi:hypothetical protein [Rhizomonospora bruguierae]|uniref:hypothetical protein n=1 Tax=Rhizomonospora bruguierae TaxID=1581705 RepID=UPI001BCBE11B|nr:hypothetical protein [Micromonospora sp. NBRC 107566]
MQAEFTAAEQALTLPKSYTWPVKAPEAPPQVDNKGVMRDNVYEPGYGQSLAENYWFCAWLSEWVKNRTSDATAAEAAIAQAQTVRTKDMFTRWTDDGGRQYISSVLDAAALGDPTAASFHQRRERYPVTRPALERRSVGIPGGCHHSDCRCGIAVDCCCSS